VLPPGPSHIHLIIFIWGYYTYNEINPYYTSGPFAQTFILIMCTWIFLTCALRYNLMSIW
jgi:hypothetical protein